MLSSSINRSGKTASDASFSLVHSEKWDKRKLVKLVSEDTVCVCAREREHGADVPWTFFVSFYSYILYYNTHNKDKTPNRYFIKGEYNTIHHSK
jgi:hypothetical protein